MNCKYWTPFLLLLILMACERITPKSPPDDSLLDGPLDGLNAAQTIQFLNGDRAFNSEVFTSATGLGPLFVATSCGSCHAGDGKGHPFSSLIRFGQTDSTGNRFLANGGPQLQHRALPGYEPEIVPTGASFAKFTPPANTGLGFLECVSDMDIMASADPYDLNLDGISGEPNWKKPPSYSTIKPNSISKGELYIHRFGKKASAHTLLHQTVNAYNQDMGITSTYEPYDTYSQQKIDAEVSNATLNDVVFYLQTLKAPVARNQSDIDVIKGKIAFVSIGCDKCHSSTLKTEFSTIEPLSNKTFHPYTDLLLHDMGPELDDGYTEGSAKTYEWRTPALWGLGLSPNSQGGRYFLMHDGRASSISQAIEMHGGEGKKSAINFLNLPESEKKAVLKFLESL